MITGAYVNTLRRTKNVIVDQMVSSVKVATIELLRQMLSVLPRKKVGIEATIPEFLIPLSAKNITKLNT